MKKLQNKWGVEMIRRIFSLVLTAFFVTGCAVPAKTAEKKQYQATFLDLFDTVTTVIGYAETEEEFQETAGKIHDELEIYHQLFDIYHSYEGIANLKTINDQAGVAPVEVDRKIIDLLLDCRDYYELTDGKVNVAMGSVLRLWHEAREDGIYDPQQAKLPDESKLKEAAKHCSFDTVMIDEDASMVYLEDPMQSLDVGAVAKGWAVEQVCRNAPTGLLVSVGGNVCATGSKPEDTPWVVGIQSPEGEADEYLHTLYVCQESVVTSGDYQRYYVVDGMKYHHLIDPETLFPGMKWKAVSVVCEDSGLADVLSTALFMLSQEEGQILLEQHSACAMWVNLDGEICYSTCFEERIRT